MATDLQNDDMNRSRRRSAPTFFTEQDLKRRKREGVIIVAVIAAISLLTFAESKLFHFGSDIPIWNTILMFILININLLLVILLIFLVFRNLVKLLYDRKRRVMGAKLRTRLVVAFIALTLLPASVLFIFSINFIATSIESWFNVPIEQALDNSLQVGQRLYASIEERNQLFIERIATHIQTETLLDPNKQTGLSHYLQVTRQSFDIHTIEVYSATANRAAMSVAPALKSIEVPLVSTDNLQKEMDPKGYQTFSESTMNGELVRTVGAIPFGVKRPDAKAYLVITTLISQDLTRNMASISKGFEEYQQIELLKKPLQITYYITLTIVALLVVFCAIWFGFYLAKSITIPLMDLAERTRRVAEGDLSFSISPVADDEIGTLVNSFNRMTRDLRFGREQLEFSAKKLQEQNVEIEARRKYMEIVLRTVSAGVITLDSNGLVTTVNTSAEKMLNIDQDAVLNRSYKRLLSDSYLETAEEIIETLTYSKDGAVEMPLKLTIDGSPRSFMTHISYLKEDTGRHLGIVLVFDDLTDLEKAQRMAAWREVARRIAHEVKNPLTPISLSAQRLKRKYSRRLNEPVFEECTRMIIDHVDLIRNLVNEFSSFARFPTANPKPCQLPPIVEESVALYREGHQNIEFVINRTQEIPILSLDRQQIKQALINLIDNAVGAVKEKARISISLSYDSALKKVHMEVADNGMGISDKDKTRLFEPYFSTKRAGMGLGLTIVSTIVSDHQGTISVQDNKPRGARFVIEFPV